MTKMHSEMCLIITCMFLPVQQVKNFNMLQMVNKTFQVYIATVVKMVFIFSVFTLC